MHRIPLLLSSACGLTIAALLPGQPRAATLTTLVNFNGTDGASPSAGLTAGADGNLFGTTASGGASGFCPFSGGCGAVFEITKTPGGYASTPTILYSFCAQAGCTDGESPYAGLIADASGNLFGTTFQGGTFGEAIGGYGTVFEIVKTSGGYASTPTVLISFNGANGANSFAGLIADANGNLFGTASAGGASGGGTVFEIVKTASGYASTPTILYSFCAQANCTDGGGPQGGLIADANGNLFGTTVNGGAYGDGTVFEIAKTAAGYASTPTILVSFNGANGAFPTAGLINDAAGNLFGTTDFGGAYGQGTVFEIANTAAGYASIPTILYSFCAQTNCADGANPDFSQGIGASGSGI